MAVDADALARGLRELRDVIAPGGDFAEALERAVATTRTVCKVDGAGLMLQHDDGALRWVTVTDDAGRLLEELQARLRDGPCVRAFRHREVVPVPDTLADARWPGLGAALARGGVRAVLSVPVLLDGDPVGTLNAYATEPQQWGERDAGALQAFAALVADLLKTGVELTERGVRVEQLEHALTSRVWVEQAKGVLVAREGLDPASAFDRLRALARSSRRKVVEVAKDLVRMAQQDAAERQRAPEGTARGEAPPGLPSATGGRTPPRRRPGDAPPRP